MLLQALGLVALISSAVSGKPVPTPAQNFTQLLDHFSNHSVTFNQSYQADTSYFRPGRPILFMQGDEASTPIAVSDAVHGNLFYDYASELGAMLVALEHRFFGTSFPLDFNAADPASYTQLTLDNIIQDSVTLVEHIKKTVLGAADSKVIATGGKVTELRHISRCKLMY